MSAGTPQKSFLDLPREVRLNVYEQLFRSTEVVLHDLTTYSTHCGDGKENSCTDLMRVCKLIHQEAKPFFFKETSFVAVECDCWYKDFDLEEPEFNLPPIMNLTIPYSMSDDFLDPRLGFGCVLSSLDNRIDQDRKLDSLICQPTLHTDFSQHNEGGLELELDVLVKDMPKIFRKVEFTFCACGMHESEKVFVVKIRREGDNQKIGVHCTQQKDVQILANIFKSFEHDFKDIAWSPDMTGMSKDCKVAHEQFEAFLASM